MRTCTWDTVLGDEMTIGVNENRIVLDQHRAGDTRHHRFITGTLTYLGER